MPTTLRDYQSKLVALVRGQIPIGKKRVLMVLPTGGGKTHVCADIASRAVEKGNKVLCLMHRRHLVGQMIDRFSDHGLSCGVIMSGEEPALRSDIQIATIQTYSRRLQLPEDKFFIDAQVVIIDEAHRSLSKTYQTVLSRYDGKVIIGVTATPCLSSGVGMGEYYDALVDYVGVSELVAQGHLVPARYYAPTKPDLDKVKTVMGDWEKRAIGDLMNTPKLIGDVFENWLRIAGGKQTIVFGVNVKHSKALCREFQRNGVNAEHLDAHNDDEERSDVLRRLFDGDTQVICNVGIYTEGFDYPGAECIVLARPTKSLGLYRQMAGRGLRPFKGKDECIIIDHGGCIDRLGFVEDAVDWSLDGKKIAWKKKTERKKDQHIMTCEYCSAAFTGKRCPTCGNEIQDYGKKIEALDAELIEVKKGNGKQTHTREEKQRWYSMFEYYRRSKGYSSGWTAHKFKEKFQCWPRSLIEAPIEPNAEVLNWVKYQAIKYAKRSRVSA